ncbi:response regulator transcription factor [Rubrimonas sp.]|uniref:response regulator transcription factor n=1 Tax=Rubrimonas sp. TaxID=2036015 RepID=UPI002FDD564F
MTVVASARRVVHVVDDDRAVRHALARLLRASGHAAETHASAEAFLDRPDPASTGCAILDMHLPGIDGLDLQSVLMNADNPCPVIFLTGRGDVEKSVRAMKTGAIDFLTKPVQAAALLTAVDRALAQGAAALAEQAARDDLAGRLALLTPREREVLDGVVAGQLNKQIAHDLGMAEKTVKVHRARVMRKMDAGSLAALVRLIVAGGPPRHRP